MKKILLILLCSSSIVFPMKVVYTPKVEGFFEFLIEEIAQEQPGLAAVLKDLEDVIDIQVLHQFTCDNFCKSPKDLRNTSSVQ